MKKTININIAGVVFQIDDDAFEKLRSYLQEVNNRFRRMDGGSEALEDFEARVAEIFQGRRGITGIVTIEDVNEMISIMGKPEDIDDGYNDEPEGEPVTSTQRRLYRDPDETIISGVAGGIGSYLNVDPVWIRLLFIMFTVFYGFGFFVYIALWIALPAAGNESRRRELYGTRYSSTGSSRRGGKGYRSSGRATGSDAADRLSGALSEIFLALGKFIVIILRIILIIIGGSFILAGFAFLALVIAALVFNYGPWMPGATGIESFYFSDIFPLILTPAVIPWVTILSLVVLGLPLLALVYWGVKLILQFRAKDALISIIAVVLWVLAAVSLTMILFTQGISFAESGRQIERTELITGTNSIVLARGDDLSSTEYEKKIILPFDDEYWFYTTSSGKIYAAARIYIYSTTTDIPYAEVKRYGHGPSRMTAIANAEKLEYNYSFRNDSLIIDTYFGLPEKARWNGSDVRVNLFLPEGTRLYVDRKLEPLIRRVPYRGHLDLGGKWWVMSENKLILN